MKSRNSVKKQMKIRASHRRPSIQWTTTRNEFKSVVIPYLRDPTAFFQNAHANELIVNSEHVTAQKCSKSALHKSFAVSQLFSNLLHITNANINKLNYSSKHDSQLAKLVLPLYLNLVLIPYNAFRSYSFEHPVSLQLDSINKFTLRLGLITRQCIIRIILCDFISWMNVITSFTTTSPYHRDMSAFSNPSKTSFIIIPLTQATQLVEHPSSALTLQIRIATIKTS